jgi:hypothetical protein
VHSYTPSGKSRVVDPSAQGECSLSKSNVPRPRLFHWQISFQWSPNASDSNCSLLRPKVHGPASHAPLRETPPNNTTMQTGPLAFSQRMILAHIDKDSSIKQRDRAAFTRLVESRR